MPFLIIQEWLGQDTLALHHAKPLVDFLHSPQRPGLLLQGIPWANPLDCGLLSRIHLASKSTLGAFHSIEVILRHSTTLPLLSLGDSYIEGLLSHEPSLPSGSEFLTSRRRNSCISYLSEAWCQLTSGFHLACHTPIVPESSWTLSAPPQDFSWVAEAFGCWKGLVSLITKFPMTRMEACAQAKLKPMEVRQQVMISLKTLPWFFAYYSPVDTTLQIP